MAPDKSTTDQQFDDFLRAHYDAVLWYAYVSCRDWQLGEDLVQECFLKLWRAWSTKPEGVMWYRSYAYTTLRHVYIDHLRKKSGTSEELRADVDETLLVEQPVDVAARNADRQEVLSILRRLPERHQEVFFLSEVCGFKPAEIANLLGMRARTVSNYLCSAKKQVAASLSPVEHNR